jgi:hypothetical protein
MIDCDGRAIRCSDPEAAAADQRDASQPQLTTRLVVGPLISASNPVSTAPPGRRLARSATRPAVHGRKACQAHGPVLVRLAYALAALGAVAPITDREVSGRARSTLLGQLSTRRPRTPREEQSVRASLLYFRRDSLSCNQEKWGLLEKNAQELHCPCIVFAARPE